MGVRLPPIKSESNMPVVMSSKPRRVRNFISNGQVYEGGAEEYYSGRATAVGNELGGNTSPDRLAEQTGGEEAKNE